MVAILEGREVKVDALGLLERHGAELNAVAKGVVHAVCAEFGRVALQQRVVLFVQTVCCSGVSLQVGLDSRGGADATYMRCRVSAPK